MNKLTDLSSRAGPDLLVMRKYEALAAVLACRADEANAKAAELEQLLHDAHIVAVHADDTESAEARGVLCKLLREMLSQV